MFAIRVLLILLFATVSQSIMANNLSFSLVSPDTVTCPDDFNIQLESFFYNSSLDTITIDIGDEISLYVWSARSLLDGDEHWIWSDPTGLSCTDCLEFDYMPIQNTTLTLTIIDGDGCMASSQLSFKVETNEKVFIPNVFSPNGDGGNDQFMIFTGSGVFEIAHLQIYSRKGDLVYEANNFLGNDLTYGWDGIFEGQPMDPGVYVYVAEIILIDGTRKMHKGTVTLMR